MKCRTLLLPVLLCTLNAFSAVIALSPDTLQKWITTGPAFDFILIDLRNPLTEPAAANIIGNDSCRPYVLVWPDTFNAYIASIPKSAHVIVYCASGNRAGVAAMWLDTSGYQHVYNAGGFSAWGTARPTIPVAQAKSKTLLPEPSMRAHNTGIRSGSPVAESIQQRRLSPSMIISVNKASAGNSRLIGLNGSSGCNSGSGVFLRLIQRD